MSAFFGWKPRASKARGTTSSNRGWKRRRSTAVGIGGALVLLIVGATVYFWRTTPALGEGSTLSPNRPSVPGVSASMRRSDVSAEQSRPAGVAGDSSVVAAVGTAGGLAREHHAVTATVGVQPVPTDPADDSTLTRQFRSRESDQSEAGADSLEPQVSVQPPVVGLADDAVLAKQGEKVDRPEAGWALAGLSPIEQLRRARVDAIDWAFGYAKALRSVPVHDQPGVAPPRSYLDPTGRWVAIEDRTTVQDVVWYKLATGGWSPATALETTDLPPFRGVELGPKMAHEVAFVATDILNVRAHAGVSDTNPPISRISRHDVVPVLQEMLVEGGTWLRIGDGLWVSGEHVRRVPRSERPDGVGPGEQWIDVNLTLQTLVAYENNTPVFATLVSSGLPRTPTWVGLSRIWGKFVWARMTGGDRSIAGDYYWLEHVPYTMYFHSDYGLHGAYWHNDFGRTKSHGCVNLSPADARWVFEWTAGAPGPGERVVKPTSEEPGTWVWTHY